MVGDCLDRLEDRLHWGDAAQVGAAGRARSGSSRRDDDGGTGPPEALERENRELRQANEILRKASAYFAQAELDRPFKR